MLRKMQAREYICNNQHTISLILLNILLHKDDLVKQFLLIKVRDEILVDPRYELTIKRVRVDVATR